jgi:hypothetical protein
MEFELSCLPGQLALLDEKASHILFCAGVASGKTEGGARWSFHKAATERGGVGFIAAQTHDQLTRVVLPPFLELLNASGIDFCYGKAPPRRWGRSRYTKHNGIFSLRLGAKRPTQIITGSMEKFRFHRGLCLAWAWLDEARDMAEEGYDVILSRFRGQPPETNYQDLLTTTPSGFNWLHQRFVDNPKAGSAIIRTKTTDNPYLPHGFVERLRAQYTEQFAKQEIDGEFVNMTAGQMYYGFKRSTIVEPCAIIPENVLDFTMDFNVSPLCAILVQHWKDNKGIPVVRVLDEIKITGSGRTVDAVEEALRRVTPLTKTRRVNVYGDTSGGNRDTRSSTTDYDLICGAFRKAGWEVDLRRNYGNPSIVDSVEAVNGLLEHGRMKIDPKCVNLIRDLEKVSWLPGTRQVDKSDATLTHLSDALRYLCAKEFPLLRGGLSNVRM